MYFKTQKFLVAGISKSGIAASEFLLRRNACVFIFDDIQSELIEKSMDELAEKGAKKVSRDSLASAISECDILVLSPGIPIDNFLPVEFRKAGKRIIGEMELGSLFLTNPTVAVTGTNGKTTVVSMIAETFKEAKIPAIACGNIGLPLTACIEQLGEDSVAVAEVSSFQLETMFSLRPHVAVVTNVAEDHLNRHYKMENYVYLKSKLLQFLRESEYAVLNRDDEIVSSFAKDCKGRAVWFSVKEKVEGAYIANEKIHYFDEEIMPVKDLNLSGTHNLMNALACVCACKLFGASSERIAAALKGFKGVKHRIESVGTVGGVEYINDSKGTNVDSTIKAVESMKKPTVLLVGGKDKGYDYDPLFEKLAVSTVKHSVLYGENRFKLLGGAIKAGYRAFTLCNDLEIAFRIANMLAREGDCVLLSPASASFDAYRNYEERGDRFVELVEGLKIGKPNNGIE